MNFNLEIVLFSATLVTGLIWLSFVLFNKNKDKKEPILVEYARSFFPVLLIVFILRSFIIEPFRIPSGSMIPTLEVGDFILVNKFSYGLRLPITHTKITEGDKVARGDVIVFRYPNDPSVNYIKRVIGLPGDIIQWKNKQVFINGKILTYKNVDIYQARNQYGDLQETQRQIETLPEGREHQMVIVPNAGFRRPGTKKIPTGHYFVMGDNRDISNDSRVWGFVPEENLVGKAMYIWLHVHDWYHFKFSRSGLKIE